MHSGKGWEYDKEQFGYNLIGIGRRKEFQYRLLDLLENTRKFAYGVRREMAENIKDPIEREKALKEIHKKEKSKKNF